MENFDIHLVISQNRAGNLAGLLGNANGDPADDFVAREGEAMEPPLSFEVLYPVFANSWRFEPGESLLHYGEGEANEDFNLMWLPARAATIDTMQGVDRSRANHNRGWMMRALSTCARPLRSRCRPKLRS